MLALSAQGNFLVAAQMRAFGPSSMSAGRQSYRLALRCLPFNFFRASPCFQCMAWAVICVGCSCCGEFACVNSGARVLTLSTLSGAVMSLSPSPSHFFFRCGRELADKPGSQQECNSFGFKALLFFLSHPLVQSLRYEYRACVITVQYFSRSGPSVRQPPVTSLEVVVILFFLQFFFSF